jgi:zinc transport system substrate-binding protein
MKAFTPIIFGLAALLFCLFFFFTPHKESSSQIVVSVAPLKYFAERIVQGKIPVSAIVHAGQDHETYEISPKEMVLLMQSKLYFSTDFPFERRWIEKVRGLNKKILIVDLPKEIFPNGENRDLHIWTSPKLAKKITSVMVEKIVAMDPESESIYRANGEQLIQDLDLLDREIGARLAPFKGEKFYVVHPAWGYFAKDYGLEEVSLERDGKEPSLQELIAIIEAAKKDHVHVIFIQKGQSLSSAEAMARSLGGKVEEIDPLEEDYFSNMRIVSSRIEKVLKDEKAHH